MPTIAHKVVEILEGDVMVREAMNAGIVNYRALARRLIEAEGLEASEAAVISALRRCDLVGGSGGRSLARRVLSCSSVTVRSKVLGISLPRTTTTYAWISKVFSSLESPPSDSVHVTYTHDRVQVFLDAVDQTRILEDIRGLPDASEPLTLTEVRITGPPTDKLGVNVASLVVRALETNEIQVVEAMGGGSIYHIFVEPGQASKAYSSIAALIEKCATFCNRGVANGAQGRHGGWKMVDSPVARTDRVQSSV